MAHTFTQHYAYTLPSTVSRKIDGIDGEYADIEILGMSPGIKMELTQPELDALTQSLDKSRVNCFGEITDTTYNGWKNYETYATFNRLSKIKRMSDYFRSIGAGDETQQTLADVIRQYVTELNPLKQRGGGLYSDIMHRAMNRIDFDALARYWMPEEPATLKEATV